mmetsp:Transcript_17638/g.57642  ORF Transcript_17638/g.57642 Transcript_17638/m.57642 type:complete len:312 (+) Transcript_17638:7140-8075(+)
MIGLPLIFLTILVMNKEKIMVAVLLRNERGNDETSQEDKSSRTQRTMTFESSQTRHARAETYNFQDLDEVTKQRAADFERMFDFLLSGYETDFYFYEMVILARKAVVVTITTILSTTGVGFQGLVLLGVVFVSLVIHLRTLPYVLDSCDQMEMWSLISAFTTIYAGMYFHNDDVSASSMRIFVTCFVVILNVVVYICFTTNVLRAMFKQKLRPMYQRMFSSRREHPAEDHADHDDDLNHPETHANTERAKGQGNGSAAVPTMWRQSFQLPASIANNNNFRSSAIFVTQNPLNNQNGPGNDDGIELTPVNEE